MKTEGIRVLCVDDNPLVADGVRIKLELEGGFEWAGSERNADRLVDVVQRERVDVVLLDIDMPGRDAMDAMRELSERLPDVRTIVLSGYSRSDYLDRAIEAGAWGFVSKNDEPDQIIQALRRVVDGCFAFGTSMVEA